MIANLSKGNILLLKVDNGLDSGVEQGGQAK